jgi:acyl carrier protein
MSPSVIDAVIVVISEQTNKPATIDSRLIDELGCDSLDCVSICSALEEELSLPFELDYDSATMTTVGDVANVVQDRLNKAQAAAQ